MFKINIPKSDIDKIRQCFWLYLFFLIFEGAFRKWIFPFASDLFLLVRDPIALYVLFLGIKCKLLKDFMAKLLILVSIISFISTLWVGHQNLFVAIYGFRITGIHLPVMFIFGNALTRDDLLKVGKYVLYCMVLMTLIIAIQYFSPQSSWINIGVGGEGSSGFGGVADFFRPSGTFSFIAGMIGFEFLAGAYLFYFLLEKQKLPKKYRFSGQQLLLLFVIYLISIFLCLSRSVMFQTIILLFFVFISIFFYYKNSKNILIFTFVFFIIIIVLLQFNFFKLGVDNMLIRFDQASDSEGSVVTGTIGNRYFGSFIRAFTEPQNFVGSEIPFWGYGLGMGTAAAAKIMGLGGNTAGIPLAEEEWSRIVGEMGYFLGFIILIIFRFFWSVKISLSAFFTFQKNKDYLPYIFIPFFFLFAINRQWGLPTLLGFCIVSGSLQIAAIKTSKR